MGEYGYCQLVGVSKSLPPFQGWMFLGPGDRGWVDFQPTRTRAVFSRDFQSLCPFRALKRIRERYCVWAAGAAFSPHTRAVG